MDPKLSKLRQRKEERFGVKNAFSHFICPLSLCRVCSKFMLKKKITVRASQLFRDNFGFFDNFNLKYVILAVIPALPGYPPPLTSPSPVSPPPIII